MVRQESLAAMRLDSYRRAEAGFTLIELVVALAVVGLTLAFVLPRLTGWVDRLGRSSAQQRFEDSVAGLGSQARRGGRTVYLRSSSPDAATAADEASIDLPRGWSVEVEPPIAFHYDGLCTGGVVRLLTPAGEQRYQLVAPYCRLQPL
jgi:prepilin-type N-terminal cleavage/methylation domain-containing protein